MVVKQKEIAEPLMKLHEASSRSCLLLLLGGLRPGPGPGVELGLGLTFALL